MPAVFRTYVTTGLAVMGAGVVTASQITPPLQKSDHRIVEAAVSLVAAVGNGQACSGYNTEGCDIWATPTYTPVAPDPNGSAANIPANLINAVLGVPRAWVDGLNDLSYALEVTGNWWVYTPTNVLGFDPADPPKITALINQLIPFKPLSNAVGDQLAWWARANLPMNAGCTGTVGPACADAGAILSVMFKAPIWTLASGYQFPELYNPVSNAEGDLGDIIPGQTGELAPWSGQYVKLNTSDWVTSVTNFLQADPATNAPKPITLDEIGASLDRFVKALVIAFNPFVPRSYLLKGWPYTALTPLFLPFVPIFCKTCNPDNPGGPPLGWTPSPAAAVPSAELVSAEVSEPAPPAITPLTDSGPADNTGEPPAAGVGKPATDSGVVSAKVQAPENTPAVEEVEEVAEVADTGRIDTSTPASRTSAARAGFPDLAPVDVDLTTSGAVPSGSAEASAPSVRKPHRGPAARASASTDKDDKAGASSSASRAASADKSDE